MVTARPMWRGPAAAGWAHDLDHEPEQAVRTVKAVHDVTFSCEPGTITGFLGPNGAGKSTTLRMLTGLTRPDTGRATIGGKAFADFPTRRGRSASCSTPALHAGRTGRETCGSRRDGGRPPGGRRDCSATRAGRRGRRRVGTYSLGMRQRLGLAHALLGSPSVLILDEPANGLDPEGIAWIRGLLRDHAARGGTVLLSSHLLAEVQATADRLVIIAGAGSSPGHAGHLLAGTGQNLEEMFLSLTSGGSDDPVRYHPGARRVAQDRRRPRRPMAASRPRCLSLGAEAVPLVFPHNVTQDRASYLTWAALGLSRLLPLVLLMAMTAEWSQRTAMTTFTLEPRRGRVLAAKVIAGLTLSVIAGCSPRCRDGGGLAASPAGPWRKAGTGLSWPGSGVHRAHQRGGHGDRRGRAQHGGGHRQLLRAGRRLQPADDPGAAEGGRLDQHRDDVRLDARRGLVRARRPDRYLHGPLWVALPLAFGALRIGRRDIRSRPTRTRRQEQGA